MVKRISSRYLWFSPLAFIPLAVLYHAVSFWAGVAGGIVHLALVVAGIRSKVTFNHREDTSGLLLGITLLVIGGAEVWATGPSGPPDPAKLSVATFNQAGLTLGFFITLLGLAATVPALSSNRERALGAVALSGFTLMFVMWVFAASLRFALNRSSLINLPPAQRPEAFQILRNFSIPLMLTVAIGGWLGGAAIAEVATRAGWVRRRAGRLMSIYCLIGILAFPLSQSLGTGSSIRDIPWLAWLMVPWLPPAMMCLVPYYVGVLGLRHVSGSETPAAIPATFATPLERSVCLQPDQ